MEYHDIVDTAIERYSKFVKEQAANGDMNSMSVIVSGRLEEMEEAAKVISGVVAEAFPKEIGDPTSANGADVAEFVLKACCQFEWCDLCHLLKVHSHLLAQELMWAEMLGMTYEEFRVKVLGEGTEEE